MMNGLSAKSEAFLAGLERANEALTRAQEQLTSGTRIQRASDAPEKAADLLLLTNQISRNEQVQGNIGRLRAEVDTSEQALQTAVNLIDRALSVGAQGANSTQVVENRQWLAQEIEGLLQTMVSLSATTVQGRHIFSGDDGKTAPYRLDSTSATGVEALTTAVDNLVDNAIKYSPEGGRIDITADRRGHSIAISIQDFGIGIAPEDRPHIFERFYRGTTDGTRVARGTGIGLSLVDQVVRAHRGRIEVASEPGRGSTFTVVLPGHVAEAGRS